ncbi:hypothetical protein QNF08_004024, partial [Vibrio vulnificus]|nr:hypothetical protein [Vibrio vulnificus]ELV8737748.1 hypothetical protein [Vibrio vulnificus]
TDAVMACNGIESEETKKAMLELNRQGFVFAYDYKAYISPSYYMKQLLLSGESGLREVGLCGIHPLTRRYVSYSDF